MKINTVNPYQSVSYTKNTTSKTDINTTNTFSISSTENEQIAKIRQANSSNTWDELSGKYDVRKATFEEIKEISKALYEAGEISTREHLSLTFDYERATNYLKKMHRYRFQLILTCMKHHLIVTVKEIGLQNLYNAPIG